MGNHLASCADRESARDRIYNQQNIAPAKLCLQRILRHLVGAIIEKSLDDDITDSPLPGCKV